MYARVRGQNFLDEPVTASRNGDQDRGGDKGKNQGYLSYIYEVMDYILIALRTKYSKVDTYSSLVMEMQFPS